MMKRYLTILSASLMLGTAMNSSAQDLHFSQFYENSVLRNPALTGIFTGDYKVGIDYRNQWGGIGNLYNTVMLSGETRVLVSREVGDYLSFGLVTTFDKAGSINFSSTQIYPAISYNKALEDQHNSYLSVGLTGGFIHRSVDQSLMTFGTQYQNGSYNSGNASGETNNFNSLNAYDVGAGVSLNSSLDMYGKFNYYIGASAYHINSPTEIFAGGDVLVKLPIKWQFNAGISLPFSDPFSLTLHTNYSWQHPYKEFIIGGLFTYRSIPVGLPSVFAFSFGAFYRANDAFIPTVKIEFKDVALGFSYDATSSALATSTSGASATEITLYLKGGFEHRKNPRDPIMCPRFEDVNSNLR